MCSSCSLNPKGDWCVPITGRVVYRWQCWQSDCDHWWDDSDVRWHIWAAGDGYRSWRCCSTRWLRASVNRHDTTAGHCQCASPYNPLSARRGRQQGHVTSPWSTDPHQSQQTTYKCHHTETNVAIIESRLWPAAQLTCWSLWLSNIRFLRYASGEACSSQYFASLSVAK